FFLCIRRRGFFFNFFSIQFRGQNFPFRRITNIKKTSKQKEIAKIEKKMDGNSISGGVASRTVDMMTNGHLTEAEMAFEMCQLIGARACYEVVKDSLKIKNMVQKQKKSYADLLSLPKKLYLETTLVPALMNGIAFVARDRPISPITTLAVYLMKNNCSNDTEVDSEIEGRAQASKMKNKLGALWSKVDFM
ncbi:unnamed protein product, partial [Phyllotreta striolata]